MLGPVAGVPIRPAPSVFLYGQKCPCYSHLSPLTDMWPPHVIPFLLLSIGPSHVGPPPHSSCSPAAAPPRRRAETPRQASSVSASTHPCRHSPASTTIGADWSLPCRPPPLISCRRPDWISTLRASPSAVLLGLSCRRLPSAPLCPRPAPSAPRSVLRSSACGGEACYGRVSHGSNRGAAAVAVGRPG